MNVYAYIQSCWTGGPINVFFKDFILLDRWVYGCLCFDFILLDRWVDECLYLDLILLDRNVDVYILYSFTCGSMNVYV